MSHGQGSARRPPLGLTVSSHSSSLPATLSKITVLEPCHGADHLEKLVLLTADCSFSLLNNINISHFLKVELVMSISQQK